MHAVETFAEELARTGTMDEQFALLRRTIEALGFTVFDYGFGTANTPRPASVLDISLHHYTASAKWENRYFELGYVSRDYCTQRTLGQVAPHMYSETNIVGPIDPVRRQMLGEIEDNGVNSGLAIPLHMLGNRFGLLHLGSPLKGAEFERLDRETRPVATLIAQIFHDRMIRDHWPAAEPVLLSPREREVLQWASQGKTAWETGEILMISERTVKKHIASAMQRLGATTRTQAVAKAAAAGLILP
jgi:DNA-binding CsgD family transcriptional regulator